VIDTTCVQVVSFILRDSNPLKIGVESVLQDNLGNKRCVIEYVAYQPESIHPTTALSTSPVVKGHTAGVRGL